MKRYQLAVGNAWERLPLRTQQFLMMLSAKLIDYCCILVIVKVWFQL